jgi:NADPH2:quinone reductase
MHLLNINFQILVKVKAAGINPVDTYIRQGEFMVLPELPTVLGKEAAGIVEEVGSEVQGIKVSNANLAI